MDLQLIKLDVHKEKTKKKLNPLQNSMEIETKTENKNKEQRKNKLDSMSFIKCVPKAKKNKRKFTLFCPQMGPKNKTSFVQKKATNNLQLFTIGKHTQNSLVFLLTNKMTKSTKPTMTTQHLVSLVGDLELKKSLPPIENVSVALECSTNLLSISQMCKLWNAFVIFDKDSVSVMKKLIDLLQAEKILSRPLQNGLYNVTLPKVDV